MQISNARAATPAGKREWTGLFILSIACLVYSMDLSVLFLAIPAITADLDPSAAELLWINDIYGFMVAGFLVTMGTLGDRIGRRKILMIGAVGFGLASLLAAFSSTAQMLIISRALLGIAGATIAPSTLSLIVNLFSVESERNRAIGIWGTAFALGGLVGPLIGGVLLEFFHWGSVFIINVPIMLGLVLSAPFLLPEFRSDDTAKLDLPSVGLSMATVLPVIYGLKHIATDGFQVIHLAPIAAGMLLGIIFIRRQKKLENPLIDLSLFAIPSFTASLLVNLFGVFFVFGIFLFQNQFLQLVIGLSPLDAAIWSAAPGLVFTIMSLQAWRITNRLGSVRTVLIGLVVNALGAAVMAVAAYQQNLYLVLFASMIIGLGFVPVVLTTTGLIVGSAPPERAGAASAISETGAEFGGAMGVALLGSLGTVIYRLTMQPVDFGEVPPALAEGGRSTLASALETAKTFGLTNAGWLEAARQAFSAGFAVSCAVATVTLLLLALLARRVYASGAPLNPQAVHGHG
ncbi:MFS transporter [Ciceribacter sp. L1K22]|uniref:MFS transporter n=1 Tax=Ciceribacter sp. L1K22 TaxID=2820275 RepID=UPI001ABE28E2|nr:MFS transporter [Ciceribacter sp. L1K22]MBO3760960.1 MFS transporter [Ciceribacter sp. L1K22]